MASKREIYDDIFKSHRGLNYREIEDIYKSALIGEYDGTISIENSEKTRYPYSPKNAVDYALRHYNNYNPNYPDYSGVGVGGDCANFISQCLHAGGMPMIGWSAQDLKSWFCRSKNKWATNLISSTWRGAAAFAQYWMLKARSHKRFDRSYFMDKERFKEVYSYGVRGDVLSLLNANGVAYHTLIIVDYRDGDVICATHSYNTNNRSLFESAPDGGVRIYRLS